MSQNKSEAPGGAVPAGAKELLQKSIESNREAQNKLNEAQESADRAEAISALGLDLDFDPRKLLTDGIIEKKGLKVLENFFIDIHTLDKREDILADRLVAQVFGGGLGLSIGKPYLECKMAATLAVAITRCNKVIFKVPDFAAERGDDEISRKVWDANWASKVELLDIILKLPSHLVDTLIIIYTNLEKSDFLQEDEGQKKSLTP